MDSNTDRSRWLTGMFRDRESAELAYRSLESRGYHRDEVNLMMSDETRRKHFGAGADQNRDTDLGSRAMEGAGVGGAIGSTVGATIAAIAAVGTALALPGLGLVVSGPLAAALAGAGAGGVTGGLIGALVGSGIPEERARAYETGVREGSIVMGISPRSDEDAEYLEREWKNAGGSHIHR